MKPIACLGDAAICLAMIIALRLGAEVRTVFVVWLLLELAGNIAKAFSAVLEPINDAMKRMRS